jgi:hypothetical protein
MDTAQSISKPSQVPRYVRDLNLLAEAHGIVTSVFLAPYDDGGPEIRLWARWIGDREELKSLGLLAPSQLRLLAPWGDNSARLRRFLTVPSSEPAWLHPLLKGEIEVGGDRFDWNLDFGSCEFSITQRGEVEAITYSDEVLLHGTASALIAAGIEKSRLAIGRRLAKKERDGLRWRSRRLPDGLHIHCFETEAAFQRRQSNELRAFANKRTHLKLVVDNTTSEVRS